MNNVDVITAGSLAALVLECVKYLWRNFVVKNPKYDFPKAFYTISVPVLNVLVIPLLYFLGVSGYQLPTSYGEWGMTIVRVLVASVISAFVYKGGIKPLRDYKALG